MDCGPLGVGAARGWARWPCPGCQLEKRTEQTEALSVVKGAVQSLRAHLEPPHEGGRDCGLPGR